MATKYAWRQNLACAATYTVITSPKFMNQIKVTFDKAGGVTMGQLVYWPKSGMSGSMLKGLAWGVAQRFLNHIAATYTKKKQNPFDDSADIILKVAEIFEDSKATMEKLAEVTDSVFKFSDE